MEAGLADRVTDGGRRRDDRATSLTETREIFKGGVVPICGHRAAADRPPNPFVS